MLDVFNFSVCCICHHLKQSLKFDGNAFIAYCHDRLLYTLWEWGLIIAQITVTAKYKITSRLVQIIFLLFNSFAYIDSSPWLLFVTFWPLML